MPSRSAANSWAGSGATLRTPRVSIRTRITRPSASRAMRSGRITTRSRFPGTARAGGADRKSTRLNSSHVKISYAVFCLKKKKKKKTRFLMKKKKKKKKKKKNKKIKN